MKRKKIFVTLSLFLLFAAVSAGLLIYNDFLQKSLSEQNCKVLEEIMQQQAYNFDLKLGSDKKTMKSFADLVAKMPYSKENILEILNMLTTNSDFDAMNYMTPDGAAYNQRGSEFSVSDRVYFKRAMRGDTVISEPVESRIRDAKIIIVAAPIVHDGKIVGVLGGSYKRDELDKLFLPSFDGAGYAYITANNGDIIAKTDSGYNLLDADSDNLFKFMEKADFYMHDDLGTIRNNFYQNKGGHSRYKLGNEKRYLHYATITVNDWNIFSIVPEQAITQFTGKIVQASVLLTSLFAAVFLLVSVYIYRSQRRHVAELARIAYVDELTGAPTLAKFKLEAQRFIDDNPDKKLLMVKFDIDRFKLINQSLGFETGDMVIKSICKALKANTPGDYERHARLHDDEFLTLLEYDNDNDTAESKERFQNIFQELMGDSFHYNVKIVSGHYHMQLENCKDAFSAIEKANVAHRKAKQSGVETCVYDEALISLALRKKDIENRMEAALKNGEFLVYLQPKYRLNNETLGGAEALVRWKPNGGALIPPANFIPLFEENGFVTKLDMYMFDKVCGLIKKWLDEGKAPITVSVNFSRLHLHNDNFVDELCAIADRHDVPRRCLEIELTESVIFDNEETLLDVLEKLHKAGFTLSMDDFGSGYSSLGLLKNLPVDVIKFDRSFFTAADNNKKALAVLVHVIEMARDMEIHTVAEGVESKEHVDLLKSLDCDMVQGYYYSKPLTIDDFEALL